jgi:hypothetical protein
MEFMVLVSILILILLLTINYNSSFFLRMSLEKNYNDAQSISDQVASEINLALKAGDGYSRIFFIPYKISDAFDYEIKVDNYLVTVSWSNRFTQSVILSKNITGSLVKGQNLIKNINGIVYVNQ